MIIKDYKCKCGHNDFFFADKGNQKGIYCTYCGKWLKWADKDEQNLSIKQEPNGDLISRYAVEEMIKAEMPERGMWEIEGDKEKETVCEVCVDLMQKLSELPPVTPQPKIGKWIDDKCSICGKGIEDLIDSREWYKNETPNYCPFCGVRVVESKVNND